MSKSEIREQIMDIKTWVEQNLCHGHNKHHPVCQRLTKLYRELEGCVVVSEQKMQELADLLKNLKATLTTFTQNGSFEKLEKKFVELTK